MISRKDKKNTKKCPKKIGKKLEKKKVLDQEHSIKRKTKTINMLNK